MAELVLQAYYSAMELRHLRYFVAVAEELHFGRAAARLHIAQPALSQQIQKLERELGVMLLFRTKRQVALTDAGAVFLAEARRTLDSALRAMALCRRAAAGKMGSLRVGYVDWAVYLRLPQIIRAFREGHPSVDLGIEEMHVQVQREALARGDLDLGFFAVAGDDSEFESELLAAEPLLVGLAESHPLASRKSVPLDALASEPWVLMQRSLKTQLVELVLATCAGAGFVPKVVQEAGQVNTVAALVSAGLGVTLLPRTVAMRPREHFVARPLSGEAPIHRLHAVWKGKLSPTADRFLALAREIGSPQSPVRSGAA
jgi:DNA-binding transcriptional LysR family regulator